MTVYTDNPAGRLHALLDSFKLNSSQQPVHSAWGAVFGVQGDLSGLLSALGLLVDLPDQVEAEVDRVNPEEFDRDAVMRWKVQLAPFIRDRLLNNERADQAVAAITEGSMASLESCSFVLHRYRPQRVLSDADIEKIRSLVQELVATIEEELDGEWELLDFLLQHAKAMSRALDHYPIVGTAALETALDQSLGAVARRGGDFAAKEYTRRESWKKFAKLAGAVLVVLQVPTTALQLPGEIRQAIEGPQPAPVEKVVIDNTVIVPSTIPAAEESHVEANSHAGR